MSELKIRKPPPKEPKYPVFDHNIWIDSDIFSNECSPYNRNVLKSPQLIVDLLPSLYEMYVRSIKGFLENYKYPYKEVEKGTYVPFNGITPYKMSFKRFKENAWISKMVYHSGSPEYNLRVRYESLNKDTIDAAHEAEWDDYNAWLKDNAEELEEIRLGKNAANKRRRDKLKESKIKKMKADLAKLEGK